MSLQLTLLPDGRRAIIVRTSDRGVFKKCRRQWGFSSHLKFNLGPRKLAAPLWFGSAIHYALEDYHGWNVFGHPREAFKAYCLATAKNWLRDLPPDAQEHYHLGIALMDYYIELWLKSYGRRPDETYWAPNPTTGVLEPQVEVNFEIPIPIEEYPILLAHCKALGADCVLYRGTIDRISVDDWGHLWVVEYKTAKVYQGQHYLTDPQVSTYVWAAGLIYDRPVVGVVYHQFIKKFPNPPRITSNGQVTTAANIVTSYPLYKQALVDMYGDVTRAPSKNQARLNDIARSENEDRDRYIVRDRPTRNTFQSQHEAKKILLELEDMLNPLLPLYPHPTRDCSRMCSFLTPCVNMDDGSDWESLLQDAYTERDQNVDRLWRRRLPDPSVLAQMAEVEFEPDLLQIQLDSLSEGTTEQERQEYEIAQIAVGDYPPSEFDPDPNATPFDGMDENGSFNMAEVN